MVQRKKFDVILRFLVDRYRRTKPPKYDALQFVVPARLPKPVIGSLMLYSPLYQAADTFNALPAILQSASNLTSFKGAVSRYSVIFALFLREQKMAVARASVADIRSESLAVRAAWLPGHAPTLAADMTVP